MKNQSISNTFSVLKCKYDLKKIPFADIDKIYQSVFSLVLSHYPNLKAQDFEFWAVQHHDDAVCSDVKNRYGDGVGVYLFQLIGDNRIFSNSCELEREIFELQCK